MKLLLTLRNRIETFYNRFQMIVRVVFRLVLSFFVLLAVRNSLGFNTLISQLWFIIIFAVICAFIHVRVLPLVLGAYTAVQVFSLAVGAGIAVFIIMVILYLIYLKLDAIYGYAILLMLLAFVIRIPLAIPLVLAVSAPLSSIFVVISSNIIYYMLHYISVNSAVFTGYAQSGDLTTASVFINGLLTYKEFIYTMVLMILVFFIVSTVRKINMDHANDMATAVGAGIYIIFYLITNVILNSLTFQRLRTILIGTAVALIIALLAEYMLIPADFSKAEFLEFDDEEYHYYVRAVPKIALDRENIQITRINSRRRSSPAREKKDENRTEDKS